MFILSKTSSNANKNNRDGNAMQIHLYLYVGIFSLFLIAREDFVDVFVVHFWGEKAYDKDYYKAS